jgi:hypothetical protein
MSCNWLSCNSIACTGAVVLTSTNKISDVQIGCPVIVMLALVLALYNQNFLGAGSWVTRSYLMLKQAFYN